MRVEMLEMLGAERLVYGQLGDTAFTLRIEGIRPPPKAGETVMLRVEPGNMHWFDVGTGQRV
jgi:sn-glycerol 3-phosphate transport system ATP-binding protein